MAARPVFIPQKDGRALVLEIIVDFTWAPGMAPSQKKKNVAALHAAAKLRGLHSLLEISSKSDEEVGRRLSAFSLKLSTGDTLSFLECIYQGSKVFQNGGPYTDLFRLLPGEAKRDVRLKQSGRLKAFEFRGRRFPLNPRNAFYDWLYINALYSHMSWVEKHVDYQGYTDIEFNPEKSVNCQARAFAELMALATRGQLDRVATDFNYFVDLLPAL
jgi:hypothetical protein